jgi:hypothetical protein
MKELKDLKRLSIEPNRAYRRQTYQPWKTAQARPGFKDQQITNRCVEAAYLRILEIAKRNLQPKDDYFERDYREEVGVYSCAMHGFMMPSFYASLDCAFDYNFTVRCAFHECSFEAEIRRELNAFPLDRQAIEVELQHGFTDFYVKVLAVNWPAFIFSL